MTKNKKEPENSASFFILTNNCLFHIIILYSKQVFHATIILVRIMDLNNLNDRLTIAFDDSYSVLIDELKENDKKETVFNYLSNKSSISFEICSID